MRRSPVRVRPQAPQNPVISEEMTGFLLLFIDFYQYKEFECVLFVSYFKKSGNKTTIGMPCTAITQSLFWVLDFAEPASWCLFGVYVGVYNC